MFWSGVKIDFLFVRGSKTNCLQCELGNWLGFCYGGQNGLDLSVRNRTWLHFSVRMKLTWLLCGSWKLTCYVYPGRKSPVFRMSTKIDLVFVSSKLTWFQGGWSKLTSFLNAGRKSHRTWLDSSVGWNWSSYCVGCRKWLNFSVTNRHWFGFCVAVENYLFLLSGSKNKLGFRVG